MIKLDLKGQRRLAWALTGVALALLALTILLALLGGILTSGTVTYLLTFNCFLVVGGLVAANRPENPIGWLLIGAGLSTNLTMALSAYANLALLVVPGRLPGGTVAAALVLPIEPMAWLAVFVSMWLFPSGRPVGPRLALVTWLVTAGGVVVNLLLAVAAPTLSDLPISNPLYNSALAGLFEPLQDYYGFVYVVLLLVTAVLRVWRASRIERLQLKWFAYAVFLVMLTSLLQGALQTLLPFQIYDAISSNMSVLALLLLAGSVGIAILRYRLYDIDIIIRRTLLYAVLTALLASVYLGGVALLQALLRPLTGEGNDLAVVLTTLLIAALFLPLRSRVQAFIDRRFYRRKYDAAKVLAAFSASLRDEVELEQLTIHLLDVVDTTMQPAQVTLWLAGVTGQPQQPTYGASYATQTETTAL